MDFTGRHFDKVVILTCVRWYLRFALSYRDLEEIMEERGVDVDHSTINRWVLKYTPLLETEARRRKRPVGTSWRMDETYIKVKGHWKYLYRAVDKEGDTIDFLLTAKRDTRAALRFLTKAIRSNGTPEKINIDQSGANTSGIAAYNKVTASNIKCRQCNYLNNIVEQDHRPVKRKMRAMMGFKTFRSASATIAGIELTHMIRKGQVRAENDEMMTPAETFYSLAA